MVTSWPSTRYLSDGHPENLDERLAREVPDTADPEVPYDRPPDAVGALVLGARPGPEDEIGEEQDRPRPRPRVPPATGVREEAAMHTLLVEVGALLPTRRTTPLHSDVENEGDEDGEDDRGGPTTTTPASSCSSYEEDED
jgi:hypothetical protein